MKEERFIVTYRLATDTYEQAKQMAWAIQVEQTIECPYEFVKDPYIQSVITGQLESLAPMEDNSMYSTVGGAVGDEQFFIARISYYVHTTALEVTQFMNVILGNSSLQPGIWVVDIELSPTLAQHFGGPRFGLAGMRQMLRVPTRPMMQAVVKPMGTPNEDLAHMCGAYTRGGVDVIKDDHGITNQSFSLFKERVARCAEAVREANAQTGNGTVYAANVSADGSEVLERAYYAKEVGATALMVAPGLVGFGWLQALAKDSNLGLPIISHPALSGGYVLPGVTGIADYLYLGMLPRIFGSDMPIFVSYGGRFTFSKEDCQQLAGTIRSPYGPIAPAVPSPGGGVTDARLDELIALYGHDTMFLIGGDMFRRSHDLEANMRYFMRRLETSVQ